ncbi:MAG: hypothetical protein LBO72_09625 [Helicobacteraceae bacterium]|jgi:hypothetical protein|nr:hypothetical protein [Helicobacteraceae bacterium]
MREVIKYFVQFLAIIAAIVFLWFLTGCAKPQIITEYRYIDRNCTTPAEVIAPNERLPIRWLAIDINATRYYCTAQGASLLTNLRSCK